MKKLIILCFIFMLTFIGCKVTDLNLKVDEGNVDLQVEEVDTGK